MPSAYLCEICTVAHFKRTSVWGLGTKRGGPCDSRDGSSGAFGPPSRPFSCSSLALMSNAEDFLRDFLPTSFGKKQTQNNLAEKFAKTKRQVR